MMTSLRFYLEIFFNNTNPWFTSKKTSNLILTKTCSVSLDRITFTAFDEPALFGIEPKSNRTVERNKKLHQHMDLLNFEVYQKIDELQRQNQHELK